MLPPCSLPEQRLTGQGEVGMLSEKKRQESAGIWDRGKGGALAAYLRRSWPAAVILLLATAVFAGLYGYAHSGTAEQQQGEAYVEYETGRVLEILSDSCEPDAEADGAYRGDQSLLVAVTSGQYRGADPFDVQCRWAAVRRASGLRGPCDAADLHLCRWKPQCHRV